MNFVFDAIQYILDPTHWIPGSRSPLPLQDRIIEHLGYTAFAVGAAALIALPLGFYIGHTGKGRQIVIGFTGAMRALPTLGLLFFLSMILLEFMSFGQAPFVGSMIALTVLAIPSLLAGAYAGIESVDAQTVDAARANGMTEFQIVLKVEIPLALPLIVGGLRAAVLQVIATATIASYSGLGGLGRVLANGIALNDYQVILAGAFMVTALALIVDGLFALGQRLTRTRGLQDSSRETRRQLRDQSQGQVAAVGFPTNEGK